MVTDSKSKYQPCGCKIIEFFLITIHTFLHKYQYFPFVLLFSLFFYTFFHSIISLLIYISQLLLCIVISVGIFWPAESSGIRHLKGEKKSGSFEDNVVVNKNANFSSQNVTNRRKNVDENPRSTLEGRDSNSLHNGESSSHGKKSVIGSDPRSFPDLLACAGGYESGSESSGNEEEVQEIAEWTEDDQKNVMDIGFSEIERNRRLETLIAKRSAKKLLEHDVEKNLNLIDTDGNCSDQISPVLTAKSCSFDAPNICEENKGFSMPNSAPSVLMPIENPLGKKDPPEDLMFRSNEIGHLGTSSVMEPEKDQQDGRISPFPGMEQWALQELGQSRPVSPSGRSTHDQLSKQLLREFSYRNDRTEVGVVSKDQSTLQETKSVESKHVESGIAADNIEEEKIDTNCTVMKELLYDSSTPEDYKNRIEDSFFYANKGTLHGSSYSIASDMQVEVSESGSPNEKECAEMDKALDDERLLGMSNFKDSASSMPLQNVVEKEDLSSVPSVTTGKPGESPAKSSNTENKIKDVSEQVAEELKPENTQKSTSQLTEKLSANLPQNVVSEKEEEASKPPEESTKKLNESYDNNGMQLKPENLPKTMPEWTEKFVANPPQDVQTAKKEEASKDPKSPEEFNKKGVAP